MVRTRWEQGQAKEIHLLGQGQIQNLKSPSLALCKAAVHVPQIEGEQGGLISSDARPHLQSKLMLLAQCVCRLNFYVSVQAFCHPRRIDP